MIRFFIFLKHDTTLLFFFLMAVVMQTNLPVFIPQRNQSNFASNGNCYAKHCPRSYLHHRMDFRVILFYLGFGSFIIALNWWVNQEIKRVYFRRWCTFTIAILAQNNYVFVLEKYLDICTAILSEQSNVTIHTQKVCWKWY